MYDTLSEPIQVGAIFKNAQLIPKMFLWRGAKFKVVSINMSHTDRIGSAKIYYFSVSNKSGAYKISFNNETLAWRLEQIYV